jgi:hypothetical protein
MAGPVPAIHGFAKKQGVDARPKAGHDVERLLIHLIHHHILM